MAGGPAPAPHRVGHPGGRHARGQVPAGTVTGGRGQSRPRRGQATDTRPACRTGGYPRMVSGERALPEQASLRYLKLEAKRRRAAGEFATLHHAQLAIAREHGQPSWTALRDGGRRGRCGGRGRGARAHAAAVDRRAVRRRRRARLGRPRRGGTAGAVHRRVPRGDPAGPACRQDHAAGARDCAASSSSSARRRSPRSGRLVRAPGRGDDRDASALPAPRGPGAPAWRADQRPAHRRAAHRGRRRGPWSGAWAGRGRGRQARPGGPRARRGERARGGWTFSDRMGQPRPG